ncbi:hypothetical protein IJ117_02650 [Candidatus Saccharibacteria bacterium]|nr:hypothetical protein [Candidatus Saccharibacteria bacterium]
MNKDVIYIEPEDDITDIITKIENSKEKIVALVPPKKAGVFRSIVNIKLIAKAGASAEKNVVLVTTDPSIVKLAAATRLPVTKSLQSAPKVPTIEEVEVAEEASTDEVVENEDAKISVEETEKQAEPTETVDAEEHKLEGKSGFLDAEVEDKADDKKSAKPTKAEKPAKTGIKSTNPFIRWIQEHKKILIGCGAGVVVLILVAIWAFVIAPAAEITVGIRTTSTNFSENVSFTEKMADENASEGIFYLEEKKIEDKAEVEFEATGKKNMGEKASGTLTVRAVIDYMGGSTSAAAGTAFVHNGLRYILDDGVVFSFDGDDDSVCVNQGASFTDFKRDGCIMSAKVSATAEAAGSDYNTTSSDGWVAVNGISVYGAVSISGGTDKIVTVVTEDDVNKAKTKIESSNESVNKAKLLDTIPDDAFVIDSSFKQTVGDAVSTPAVGEEVKDGEKAKLSVTTTDTIYIIDGTKVEEFIREKAKLADNFKIYEMNDPFIENFTKTDNGYVAKLKTSYVSGPKLTESDVVEIVKGKGIGTARQDLEKAYDGISRISIQANYPWVSSIPNDNNKITVNIEVDSK